MERQQDLCCESTLVSENCIVISLANRLASPAKQRERERLLRTAVNGRGRRPSGGEKELEQLMDHQQNAQVSLEMLLSLFSFHLGITRNHAQQSQDVRHKCL